MLLIQMELVKYSKFILAKVISWAMKSRWKRFLLTISTARARRRSAVCSGFLCGICIRKHAFSVRNGPAIEEYIWASWRWIRGIQMESIDTGNSKNATHHSNGYSKSCIFGLLWRHKMHTRNVQNSMLWQINSSNFLGLEYS